MSSIREALMKAGRRPGKTLVMFDEIAEFKVENWTEEGRETLRRVLAKTICRNAGHDWRRDARGAPVTDFNVCKRCGKWER